MTQKHKIQLFEEKKVRTVWDDEQEEWYFSVVDVCAVLTDQPDYDTARKYWNKVKERLVKEGSQLVTDCHQLKMVSPKDGKRYKTDVASTEQLFRLIQSIPSKKAEPFKLWMAQVAKQRLDQMADPELSIQQAIDDWRRKGYSENWINNRVKSIEVRKALTDEWQRTGVSGQQYATFTDIITQEWSGMTTRQYKSFKGLKKENLRDHMTRTESALNTLAEVAATELSQKVDPKGFIAQKSVAKRGGKVAATARRELEMTIAQ